METNILVVKGQFLRNDTESFAANLEKTGCTVRIFDLLNDLNEEKLEMNIDAIISFNGVGYDRVRKITDAPYFCYMIDYQDEIYNDFWCYKSNDYILCSNRNQAKLINMYYNNIGGVFFLPQGERIIEDVVPYKNRKIDVLFCGDYYSSEHVLGQLYNDLQPFEQKIANVLIMKMQNRHILLEDALREFLQENQVDYVSEEFIELYQQYQGTIDYIKALYQEKLIENIVEKGIRLNVLGVGWDKFKTMYSERMMIYDVIDENEKLRLMGNSKIVLSNMLWYEDGANADVIRTVLCGAIGVIGDNNYLRDHLKNGINAIYYDVENTQELADKIMYYLINEGEAERIAIDHCIKQNFSWEKRTQEFLNTLCYVTLSNISVKSSLDLIIDQYNHFAPKEYARVYNKIEKFLDEVVDSNKENLSDEDLMEIINRLDSINSRDVYYHVMTFLICAYKRNYLINHLIDHVMCDSYLIAAEKFNLYFWLVRYEFLNSQVFDVTCNDKMKVLYSHILDSYKKELDLQSKYICKENRNQNLIFVTVGQFLGLSHGPTKTTLDRCEVLETQMGKRTFIINTAEMFAPGGASVACYHAIYPGYSDELSNKEIIEYNGRKYSYFQCEKNMPNLDVIREVTAVVQEEKPYFILNIGGNSILTDVCSQIVPTISLSTVPSNMTTTRGQFQIIGRCITEKDKQIVKELGLPTDHLIQTLFTSSFKKQTHKYRRQDLGMPGDGFIVLMVGGRLGQEIDREFEDLIEELMDEDIYFAFMGNYSDYDRVCERHPIFNKYGLNLGFQQDALAVNELCDLYLNPKRVGGGTSVAEALYKGLPAVTLDFGDVGLGAGKEFCVTDYDEMKETVIRYKTDRQFYLEKSKKAKERAIRLTDSKTAFMKAIRQAENSIYF